jgi:signal peptidase II
VGLVGLDQWVKWWTVTNIGGAAFDGLAFRGVWLDEAVDFIPHVLGLNFATNTGGGWSILSEHTWLLTAVSAAVSLVILLLIATRWTRHPVGVVTLSVLLAGAVGNLIDRAVLGFVVDMFRTLFMDFPVFNVADICVVCGAFGLCFYVGFFYDKLEGKDGTHSSAD